MSFQLSVFWVEAYDMGKYPLRGMFHDGCSFCSSTFLVEKWIFYFSKEDKGTKNACNSCAFLKKREYLNKWLAISPKKRMVWGHQWITLMHRDETT